MTNTLIVRIVSRSKFVPYRITKSDIKIFRFLKHHSNYLFGLHILTKCFHIPKSPLRIMKNRLDGPLPDSVFHVCLGYVAEISD